MELAAVIISGVGALAAVASAIAAFKANNKIRTLTNQINNSQQRKINNKGNVKNRNDGENTGTMIGINTGDLK